LHTDVAGADRVNARGRGTRDRSLQRVIEHAGRSARSQLAGSLVAQ